MVVFDLDSNYRGGIRNIRRGSWAGVGTFDAGGYALLYLATWSMPHPARYRYRVGQRTCTGWIPDRTARTLRYVLMYACVAGAC
jgi:hypothetical protein